MEGGAIVVLLQREQMRIACEISVTTEFEHEAANVHNCLGSGARRVLVADELARVTFVPPPGVIATLDEQGAGTAPEATPVLGYKVRTSVRAGVPGDGTREQSVTRTIVQAMQRLKRK